MWEWKGIMLIEFTGAIKLADTMTTSTDNYVMERLTSSEIRFNLGKSYME